MLSRMPIPGPTEHSDGGSPRGPQYNVIRLIRIALWRERSHTAQLLKDQLLAISADIGLVEKRMLAKLEDIDASLNLIAGELARRADDPSSGDVAHGARPGQARPGTDGTFPSARVSAK